MKREEEIWEASDNSVCRYYEDRCRFKKGAEWADEHPKSPWISVKERLPESNDEVLIKFFTEEDDLNELAGFDKARGIFYVNGNTVIPNYWMPIPEIKKDTYIKH